MTPNFLTALKFVLEVEGGFSNHPKDPGGATNFGVTQAVYSKFLKERQLADRSVQEISDEQVREIYFKNYWVPTGCEHMPLRTAIACFDCAVNMGVKRSVSFLQSMIFVESDGIFGKKTKEALENTLKVYGEGFVIKWLLTHRDNYYNHLQKKMSQFILGWKNRLIKLSIFLFSLEDKNEIRT